MERQMLLHRQITRALDNFKKLGRNNYTPAIVRSRMRNIKELWQQFNDAHLLIEKAVPEATRSNVPYFAEAIADDTEDRFNQTLDFMAEELEALEPPVSPNQGADASFIRPSPGAISLNHLPPIQIAPFDGTPSDWEPFRDRFAALIIKNKDLNNFSRLHFLISFLRGRALETIADLAITDDNFSIAWEILKDRYDNTRRLLSVHFASLLSLPHVARESPAELQDLRGKVKKTVSALTRLRSSPTELWDDILVHIISQSLDPATRKAWSLRTPSREEPPSYAELDEFIATRIRALEDCVAVTNTLKNPIAKSGTVSRVHIANPTEKKREQCPLCQASHFLSACQSFLKANPSQRRELAQKHRRCYNCLSPLHTAQECKSKFSCRTCRQRHHSLLHVGSDSGANSAQGSPSAASSGVDDVARSAVVGHVGAALLAAAPGRPRASVLLATARVRVGTANGRYVIVRALLDQGSELTFLSENVAQLLRARRERVHVAVSAVGGVPAGIVRHAVDVSISPRDSVTPSFAVTALILRNLTSYAPRRSIDAACLSHLEDIPWADPAPLNSDPIQMIIGANLYADVLCEGLRKGAAGLPSAQKSAFGWVISGGTGLVASQSLSAVASPLVDSISVLHCSGTVNLDAELRRFWEVEELPRASSRSPDEEKCEAHFVATHSRDLSGRYSVRLPFRTGPPIDIGSSRERAKRLLASLSRRLQLNSRHRDEYFEFLREYERLGHMSRVAAYGDPREQVVFIPHHPVVREHSLTTTLRVVFNASSTTANGSSLNDHLLAGPKLQLDLPTVMLRWRAFRFVYAADIEKMYRQISIDTRDRDYQRILWTETPDEKPIEYQLLTVTYGMACAPFLSLRVLQQLTIDEGSRYPLASSILKRNIYVDDLLFGGDTTREIKQKRDQLTSLLRRGGFSLRKWSSNSSSLLEDIDARNHGLACSVALSADETVQVLGIAWIPADDTFRFQVSLPTKSQTTKRSILSTIARLYDPSGWVTPIIVAAKIFMQSLWRLKLGWDDELPPDALSRWQEIRDGFSCLDGVRIPRWIGLGNDVQNVELHGFADASNVAYAAVVYLRVTYGRTGSVLVSLLASKSKVAPLRPLSVPRLELSAAVLLARLIKFVGSDLDPASCYCWSDSTVVLNWLATHPSRWKTFVANRVADIQKKVPHAKWRHVPTDQNPADCASRGLIGSDLLNHPLWWQGPQWLIQSAECWPTFRGSMEHDEDIEEKSTAHHGVDVTKHNELLEWYSSWPRLIRITAYIMRFVASCRRHATRDSEAAPGIALNSDECSRARTLIIKQMQSQLFPQELFALTHNTEVSRKSPLLSLRPFLDSDGLIRVGGRLARAPLPFPTRHPVILASHRLTDQIIDHAHLRSLHSGIQLTLSVLRREFWLVRARSLVRNRIHRCVTCTRERAAVPEQLMGDLPRDRVTAPSRSFLHAGVDYAGPVQVRASAGRGVTSRKAYIALFVCLATRAIHLELVTDYSSKAFLNAFSRFCSRRGLPSTMYSDNGTTFVGADRELSAAYRSSVRDPDFQNRTATDGVRWKFIPPAAPHFGGLWEAGVKSVKHHLRRSLKDHRPTYEEFSTLLCNIEACLNSRPIAPLSDALDDYEPLTPGHFLIGAAITTAPEPTLIDVSENRLSRWQLIRQLTERFWRLWHTDYVNTLQQRSKWRQPQSSIRVGQLVLVRNAQLPPCKWELGRVVECHPGHDGLVRVATVRTATSTATRPISKLCVLPSDCERNAPAESAKTAD